MIITLIGYRGSGKSSVAEPLAARLGWDWIDADVELERRAGRSIADIFAADGEPAFRAMERQLLAELLGGERLVLAAGGGAVLDPQTRRLMQESGPVVWLRAGIKTIHARLRADRTTAARRPDLTADGGLREIEQLLAQREPVYGQAATLSIDTDCMSVAEIVQRIVEQWDADPEGEC